MDDNEGIGGIYYLTSSFYQTVAVLFLHIKIYHVNIDDLSTRKITYITLNSLIFDEVILHGTK